MNTFGDWVDFLSTRGAIIDAGGVTRFGEAADEVRRALEADTLMELSAFSLLSFEGEDAATFLHGQLTNDVESLTTHDAAWYGYCTAKGRLLATLVLWRAGEREYRALVPRSLAAALAKRLQMFVLRAKVKIADVSDSRVRFALKGSAPIAALARSFGVGVGKPYARAEHDAIEAIGLPHDRVLVTAPLARAEQLWNALAAHAHEGGAMAFRALAIGAGEPWIMPATQDQFVPQMVNLERIGGVNFRKGCYPGQEIVARSQYLGKLKRHMLRVTGDGAAPAPGVDVYTPALGEQGAGVIVDAVALDATRFEALVCLTDEAASDVRLGSLDGPRLVPESLPYAPRAPQAA